MILASKVQEAYGFIAEWVVFGSLELGFVEIWSQQLRGRWRGVLRDHTCLCWFNLFLDFSFRFLEGKFVHEKFHDLLFRVYWQGAYTARMIASLIVCRRILQRYLPFTLTEHKFPPGWNRRLGPQRYGPVWEHLHFVSETRKDGRPFRFVDRVILISTLTNEATRKSHSQ